MMHLVTTGSFFNNHFTPLQIDVTKLNRQHPCQLKKHIMKTSFAAFSALALSLASSQAITILGTTFDGRTLATEATNNDSASGLNWTTNGVEDPGFLTATPDEALGNGFGQFQSNGLFQTPNTQDAFVPNLNIHNEGSYFVDIPLNIGPDRGIILRGLSFTGIITSNGGAFQGVGREVDYRAEVYFPGPGDTLIGADNVNGQNVFENGVAPFPTTNVELDFGGIELEPATPYLLRLYVGTEGVLVGNNAGFDDLEIHGDLIPEPGVGLLGALASLLLLGRRR